MSFIDIIASHGDTFVSQRQRASRQSGNLTLSSKPAWRLLPVILAAAFAARVAVVLGGDFIYHPDVVFQYLEPAWRLLTGDGLVVWEQFYGARSQLIPAALALVMMALQALGFDHPTLLRTALELVLCAVSLLIPWGMYAFARTAFDEFTGRVALVLGATWFELVALAGQPLSEILALSPLIWGFALAADVRSASRARTLGYLLVVACALRLQYGPVVLWLVVLAWQRMAPRCRRHFLAALAVGLGLVGVFDLVTVGPPLYRSYFAYLAFNALFAETFDAQGAGLSWFYHPLALVLMSGGLAVAAFAAGLLRDWHDTRVRCALWLLVPITMILVTHAISPWKEYRYVLVTVPLWLVLLATAVGVPWIRTITGARIAVTLFGAWFIATGALGMLSKLPFQGAIQQETSRRVPLHLIGPSDPRLQFATSLADDNGLVGLAQIGLDAAAGVGNVHLGRAVPIYDVHTIETLRGCGFVPRDYASHAIIPPGSPVPSGFAVTQTGEFGWRLAERTARTSDPPWPLTPHPIRVDTVFGVSPRQLFEGDMKTNLWMIRAWRNLAGEGNGLFPLSRFRVHGFRTRIAPESRLDLPRDCSKPSVSIVSPWQYAPPLVVG